MKPSEPRSICRFFLLTSLYLLSQQALAALSMPLSSTLVGTQGYTPSGNLSGIVTGNFTTYGQWASPGDSATLDLTIAAHDLPLYFLNMDFGTWSAGEIKLHYSDTLVFDAYYEDLSSPGIQSEASGGMTYLPGRAETVDAANASVTPLNPAFDVAFADATVSVTAELSPLYTAEVNNWYWTDGVDYQEDNSAYDIYDFFGDGVLDFTLILTYELSSASLGAGSHTFQETHLVSVQDIQYVAAVPVPATLWLFGSSLVGLAMSASRRKRRRAA